MIAENKNILRQTLRIGTPSTCKEIGQNNDTAKQMQLNRFVAWIMKVYDCRYCTGAIGNPHLGM